ncbi:MAG: sugar phosphate isomerase/epimerase [Clostridia bacterium]|nr:sugar phosphate isomerase/epimerase [Clostridia bacterium]
MRFTFYTRFNSTAARLGMEAAADYAAEHGFSAVEVLESAGPKDPVLIPDREAARKTKQILAQRGLSTACWSVGTTVYKSPAAVESLKRQAEIASELECPFLHHTLLLWLAPFEGMPSFSEGIACAADAAVQVARYAEPLGVKCIYEDQGLYANGVEGFGAFYRQVKQCCGNVGVCGDVGNSLFVDEGAERFFEAYAEDICHVHIKDYLVKKFKNPPSRHWYPTRGGRWLRETMVGDGNVNLDRCMDILKKAGYSGTYALELSHPEPFEEGVKQAMTYLSRWE